uniref:Uncharacterized protein n=1 Tax=Branchiostoma floridae TaxID=7739 RepID=C3YM80_BRAFL|eukprot:XP_002602662.1 hypothetical protein BRAFLDRAFT_72970 [Branchiostoma floridae]
MGGRGTLSTLRRKSLPLATQHNTYWEWEVQDGETHDTKRRESLPLVTPPNTYWPWELIGEGKCNISRRSSLPFVTPPNTYWPWELPEPTYCEIPDDAAAAQNTYSEIPDNIAAATRPLPGLPHTYLETTDADITAESPLSASQHTYTGATHRQKDGTRITPRRASLPLITLPNTYWPWELPGDETIKIQQAQDSNPGEDNSRKTQKFINKVKFIIHSILDTKVVVLPIPRL